MCGRYVLATPIDELASFFEARRAAGLVGDWAASYNIAPTKTVVCLAPDADGGRVLDAYRWGLIPSWAKDPAIGNRLFNARSETVAVKPSFRGAFKSRRLVVVADGFYEWRRGPGARRQPYFLSRSDRAPMAFAGLWESWHDPATADDDSAWVHSCTIITTAANDEVSPIHDRMPVVLEHDALEAWLDPSVAARDELEALLRPASPGTLAVRAVGPRVGNVRNNGPDLIEEVAPGAG
ncbi:MAG: SOS response-associated peptidase [Acidimicrobiales bacterium]